MKYELSELKRKFDELGVFGIEFLPYVNANYTNSIALQAKQWYGGSQIKHWIECLTFEDGFKTLLERAMAFSKALDDIKPESFQSPDIYKRNMVGHINDGNFTLVKDIGSATNV